eukprot:jgi/Mesvir1/28507/Mv06276-RA.1
MLDISHMLPNADLYLRVPIIGFGTAGFAGETKEAVKTALHVGYRMLDTAEGRAWYRQDLVGEAIAESGVPRSQIFIISKVHPENLGYDTTIERVRVMLKELRTSYLDLVLIHYPACWGDLCINRPAGTWQDSWRALEDLVDARVLRAIGVSNFGLEDLDTLEKVQRIPVSVVERYSDPLRSDRYKRQWCLERGIAYIGYSTLGSQWAMRGRLVNPVLNNPVIQSIGRRLGKSPAQVVLRWALAKGQLVIPRSRHEGRMVENMDLAFEMPLDDISAIDALDGKPVNDDL